MRRQRTLTAVLVVLAAVLTVGGPALADAPAESGVVVRSNAVTGGVFYFGDGYVVLTGNADFAEGCAEQGFVERTIVMTLPGNGSYHERMNHHEEPLLVFEADVNSIPEFFAWIGSACASGETPIASGVGMLDSHIRVDASGDVSIHNGTVGRVTTSDGRDVHLRTWVQLTVESGVQTIHRLVVDYGG
jgi:hypothetical protein